MASLRAEGIDTLVPVLVLVARVASPTHGTATLTPPHAPPRLPSSRLLARLTEAGRS